MKGLVKKRGLEIGKGLVKKTGLGEIIPFFSDLNTWHKTITDNIFAESINNLPAKFLPRVADLDGVNTTGDNIIINSPVTITDGDYIEMSVIFEHIDSYRSLFGLGGTTDYLRLTNGNESNGFEGETSTNGDIFTITHNQNLQVGVNYILRFGWNGNRFYFKLNDVTYNAASDSIDNRLEITRIGQGYFNDGFFSGKIIYIKINEELIYYPTGQGDYEYDVSGNNNHGTWAGTGTRFDYDSEGSTYPNDNGYSQWRHSTYPTLPDIQVPFDINGQPLSLTAGVDIPAGYSLYKNHAAGGNKWNMEDSLVDIDPDNNNVDIPRNLAINEGDPTIVDNNTIICDNDATVDLVVDASYWVVGTKYKINATISNYAGGGTGVLLPYDGSVGGLVPNANGEYEYEYTPANANMFFGTHTNVGATIVINSIRKSSAIDIFDRSSTVKQTAFSRASLFYNVNFPFRGHVTEFADPRIYNKSTEEFFEAAWRDMIFGKVLRDGVDIIRLDELEGYGTQKVGVDLTKVTNYNNITDIYHI